MTLMAWLRLRFGRKVSVSFRGVTTDGATFSSTVTLVGFRSQVDDSDKEKIMRDLEYLVKSETGKTVERLDILGIVDVKKGGKR